MKQAIQVEGLRKSYGKNPVLKGISFTVAKGEIFALLGVNGAGKTTALECMEGLRKQEDGRVRIHGRSGIQLQSASLPEHMKGIEAITLFAKWNRAPVSWPMLERLGIGGIKDEPYGALSTGQKRRLHLALALTGDPDVLFLDEPTAGLDVEGRVSLHEQIRQLKNQGKTIVLASHDMAEVESLCDRIAILARGEIAFLGTVEELTRQMDKNYHISIKTAEGVAAFDASDVGETLLELLTEYRAKNVKVLDIQVDRGSLEQHFMKIAKGEWK